MTQNFPSLFSAMRLWLEFSSAMLFCICPVAPAAHKDSPGGTSTTSTGTTELLLDLVRYFQKWEEAPTSLSVIGELGTDASLHRYKVSVLSDKDLGGLRGVIDARAVSELAVQQQPDPLYVVECSECVDPVQLARVHAATSNLAMLIPAHIKLDNFTLQLNSRLYTYSPMEGEDRNSSSNSSNFVVGEVYAVKNGPRLMNELGIWPSDGAKSPPFHPWSMWERRTNLGGAVIVEAYLKFMPFFNVIDDDNETPEVEGFFVDIIDTLARRHNFSLDGGLAPDGKWGGKDADGAHTGLVGMLERREIDICVAGVNVNSERQAVIDFTFDMYKETESLVTKASGTRQGVNLNGYVETFVPSSWVVLFIVTFVVSLVLSGVRKLASAKASASPSTELGYKDLSVVSAFALVVLMVFQRDFSIPNRVWSTKVAYLTACIYSFFIFAGCTATLTSTTISLPKDFSIESFEDLLKTDLKLGVWENSEIHDKFRYAHEGTIEHTVYKEKIEDQEDSLFNSQDEALEIFGRLGNKYAIFDYQTAYSKCHDLTAVKDFAQKNSGFVAIALQKDSEFKDFLNFHLLHMKQSGLFDRLAAKWRLSKVSGESAGTSMDSLVSASALDHSNLGFPFLSLIFGVVLSMVVGLVEMGLIGLRGSRPDRKQRHQLFFSSWRLCSRSVRSTH